MSTLTLDDAAVEVLTAVKGEVTLLDKSGKVLGRFHRTMSPEEMAARNPFTLEDLEEARRRAALDGPGSPLSEIWERIHRRAGQ